VRCAPFSCFFLDRDLRIEGSMTSSEQRRNYNNFENSKNQCLGKRDKSSAGRIDPHVVEICAVLNELPAYYTTSSCAGRSFLYKGPGIKSTLQFERFRVNHDKINDPVRYFDLSTLEWIQQEVAIRSDLWVNMITRSDFMKSNRDLLGLLLMIELINHPR
jgi:hypothetical protein